MSKQLTIGTETFLYPEQGTNPGWGEEAADWACAITTRVNSLSGPNDINLTSASIINSPCVSLNVGAGTTALKFPPSCVRSFEVSYNIVRGAYFESGSFNGFYNGSSWVTNQEFIGCAGVCLSITSLGQVQYRSSTIGSGTITFKAKTL